MYFVFCKSQYGTVALKTAANSSRLPLLKDLISGKPIEGIGVKDGKETLFKIKVPVEGILFLAEC